MDKRWIVTGLLLVLTPINALFWYGARTAEGARARQEKGFVRVHVIDRRTRKPLQGAEVVIAETEQRLRTDAQGWTPRVEAPLIRDPRFRPIVAELHGQLSLIVYKNGYRDQVFFGVRIDPGATEYPEVWMIKVTKQDRRLEPDYYRTPYHRLWLIRLCDRFRSKTQPGLGPERPELSRPDKWGPELLGGDP